MAISDVLLDSVNEIEEYGEDMQTMASHSIVKAMRETVRINVDLNEEDLEMVYIPRKEYEALKNAIRIK